MVDYSSTPGRGCARSGHDCYLPSDKTFKHKDSVDIIYIYIYVDALLNGEVRISCMVVSCTEPYKGLLSLNEVSKESGSHGKASKWNRIWAARRKEGGLHE